jgi:hypothetical protein
VTSEKRRQQERRSPWPWTLSSLDFESLMSEDSPQITGSGTGSSAVPLSGTNGSCKNDDAGTKLAVFRPGVIDVSGRRRPARWRAHHISVVAATGWISACPRNIPPPGASDHASHATTFARPACRLVLPLGGPTRTSPGYPRLRGRPRDFPGARPLQRHVASGKIGGRWVNASREQAFGTNPFCPG